MHGHYQDVLLRQVHRERNGGSHHQDRGLVDHLGTSDVREVLERIKNAKYARLIYDAMIYQIAKNIGAYATVLKGEVDAILLTGGIAHDPYLVDRITEMVKYIGPVKVYAGEFEMEAMAAGP